jgi:predicted ATPase
LNGDKFSHDQVITQIVTVVAVRGKPLSGDLSKELLQLGSVAFEEQESCSLAYFQSPSTALNAAIEIVSEHKDALTVGISTAEVSGDLSKLRLSQEADTLAQIAGAGEIIVSLTVQELVRTFAGSETRFYDLGSQDIDSTGTKVKAFAVADSRLPESRLITSNRRPYLAHRFIGRQKELESLGAMVETSRLISILGDPGIGKSALAARFDLEVQDNFNDGSRWVDLSLVSAPHLLLYQIAKALDVLTYTNSSVHLRIQNSIADKEMLLVLDGTPGLEHQVADFCEQILRECHNVVIVTTGLRRLDINFEEPYILSGLDLPLPFESIDAIGTYDAVEFFLKEAITADSGFRLSPDNVNDVVGIVNILEGSPEALTIVASRLATLSARQLHGRLKDDLLGALKGSGKQGVQKALDLTVSLLSPWAKALFESLSVFAGLFDIEATEAVCCSEVLDEAALHAALKELCDLRLVRRLSRSGGDPAFFVPLVAREYAKTQLAKSGHARKLESRKKAWLDARLNSISGAIAVGGSEALDQLDVLYEDLRVQWHDQLRAGKSRGVIKVMVAIAGYWFQRGYYSEGLEVVEELLAAKGVEPSHDLGRILTAATFMAFRSGRYEEARSYVRMAVRYLTAAQAYGDLGKALGAAGGLAFETNHLRAALKLLRRANALAEQYLDPGNKRIALQNLAAVLIASDELIEGGMILERLAAETESQWADLSLINNQASLRARQGDLRGTREKLLIGCERITKTPDPNLLSSLYSTAAWAAMEAGRLTEASSLLKASTDIAEHYALALSPRREIKRQVLMEMLGSSDQSARVWNPNSPVDLLRSLVLNW